MEYISDIHNLDEDRIELLINASIQAYNAFNTSDPAHCQWDKIKALTGYEVVDYWTGVDTLFTHDKTVEVFGLVFRTTTAPWQYIFAFRGTDSILDILDDLGVDQAPFYPFSTKASLPSDLKIESGFQDVYHTAAGATPSMQAQVFGLIEKYQQSDKPIQQLWITGHSLGAALSQLFMFDLALSSPGIDAWNINFASPRVGNEVFVKHYQGCVENSPGEQRSLRVQNIYDKVPCVPPEDLEYAHVSPAFINGFYADNDLGRLDLLACHSSLNYQAVIQCSINTPQGVCINTHLKVPGQDYPVLSCQPNQADVCSFWV